MDEPMDPTEGQEVIDPEQLEETKADEEPKVTPKQTKLQEKLDNLGKSSVVREAAKKLISVPTSASQLERDVRSLKSEPDLLRDYLMRTFCVEGNFKRVIFDQCSSFLPIVSNLAASDDSWISENSKFMAQMLTCVTENTIFDIEIDCLTDEERGDILGLITKLGNSGEETSKLVEAFSE